MKKQCRELMSDDLIWRLAYYKTPLAQEAPKEAPNRPPRSTKQAPNDAFERPEVSHMTSSRAPNRHPECCAGMVAGLAASSWVYTSE